MHLKSIYFSLLFILAVPMLPWLASAQDTESVDSSGKSWLAPPSGFYPPYIADPRRPQTALLVMFMHERAIPEVSGTRFGVRLGGRFGLVRFHPEGDRTRGWQIDISAGFTGQFDIERQLDATGWDGVYGIFMSYKPSAVFGFRTGIHHDSAHISDEYIENTGRQRIRYTREELVMGVSWDPPSALRLYLEGGSAYTRRGSQEQWRLQTGVELIGKRRFWNDRFSWYGAVDVNFFEERAWKSAVAGQIGLVMPHNRGTAQYRLAVEVYRGRTPLGEFSFSDESYYSLGFYVDF